MCDINNISFCSGSSLGQELPFGRKMIHPLGVIMDASADNCAAKAIGLYKSNHKVYTVGLVILLILPLVTVLGYYVLGKPITELASSSSVWTAVINYVTIVVLATSTTLLNRRVVKDLQGCVDVIDTLQKKSIENDKLQWELDACRNENSELLSKLAEAEARAESYRKKIPKELLELEDAIKEMLELNSSQHTSSQRTSDHSRNISSCPRQQEYPPDVRTR